MLGSNTTMWYKLLNIQDRFFSLHTSFPFDKHLSAAMN